MTETNKTIRELVNGAKTIGISGHDRPDGDCIGSTLGLYLYVKKIVRQNCSDAQVKLFLDFPSEKFNYIKGFEEVDTSYEFEKPFDVFFSMDSSTTDRLGKAEPMFYGAKTKVVFDHHISNVGFGDVRFIEPEKSSTCEVLFHQIPDEDLDEDIAIALYTGIIHDSGVLQYSCTSPTTLRAVARLVEFGFDFSTIIDESFYQRTYVQNQILGRAICESERILDNRAIYTVVTREMMEFYGVGPKDLDGIVNQLRVTQGVHVAIFLYETGDLEYKVSMRADDCVDVSVIAAELQGGGHKKAAGCTMKGNPQDIIRTLSEYIRKQLDA